MVNKSVLRFKALTEELKKEVREQAVKELHNQAKILAKSMVMAAPHDTGNLQHSVRIIPGKKDTQVKVVAGGKLTIRPGVSSKPFDYARADEFGTRAMPAKPFFFTTYRANKKKIKSTIKRKISKAIKDRSAE